MAGFRSVAYDIPRKSIAGYYPECNNLIPLWHFAEGSKVPAAKSVPVRIFREGTTKQAASGQWQNHVAQNQGSGQEVHRSEPE